MRQKPDFRRHQVLVMVMDSAGDPRLSLVLELDRDAVEPPPARGQRLTFGACLPYTPKLQEVLNLADPTALPAMFVVETVCEPMELLGSEVPRGSRHYVTRARPISTWVSAEPNWPHRAAELVRTATYRVRGVTVF